jgi:hypothetical protein
MQSQGVACQAAGDARLPNRFGFCTGFSVFEIGEQLR